jgi:hypothetical protein
MNQGKQMYSNLGNVGVSENLKVIKSLQTPCYGTLLLAAKKI